MAERRPDVVQFAWVNAKNLLFAQLADQTWAAVKFFWPEPRVEMCDGPKLGRNKYGQIAELKPAKTRIVKPETPEPVVQSCVLNVEGQQMLRGVRDIVHALPATYTRSWMDFRIDARWGKIFPAVPLETGKDGKPIVRCDMYTRCKQFARRLYITDSGSGADPTDCLPLEAKIESRDLLVTLPDEQMEFVRKMAKEHGVNARAEVSAILRRAVAGS